MATIYERIRKVTIDQLGVGEEDISAASSFVDELGADSLDLVELIMALEEEFSTPERKVSIPDEDAEKIITVQDAVDYIRDLGISDYQQPPKPVEKKPASRINLPKPSFHKSGASKIGTEQPPFKSGGQPRGSQSAGGKQSGGHSNRSRQDNRRSNFKQRPPQPSKERPDNQSGNANKA